MNVQTQLKILAAADSLGGVLTPDTAAPLGITRKMLAAARDKGLLARPVRGVYLRPGVELTPPKLVAARMGPPAVLSYRGAANDYGLDGVESGVLEWSVPYTRKPPRVAGVYRRARFDELEVVERNGLMVTSVAQTLADLGKVLDADRVEQALESALRLELVTEPALREFASRASGRHGAPTLRLVLQRRPVGIPPTESYAETLLWQAYRRFGVRQPGRQVEIYDGDNFVGRIDFHWWPVPFGVEVVSLGSHGSHQALQYDATRGNNLSDAGQVIRYFTYWDVEKRPLYVCRKTERGLALAHELFPNGSQVRRRLPKSA